MTNLVKLLLLNAVLFLFLAGGFVYVNSETAVSTQPLELNFIDFESAQADYPYLDLATESQLKILTADNKCGNETCTDSECCCLNTDTQAQCCRPKVDDSCVASCQKSDPC